MRECPDGVPPQHAGLDHLLASPGHRPRKSSRPPSPAAGRHRPTGNRPKNKLSKIFDRAYIELIWKFQQERYSDLHLKIRQNS